MRRREFIAGLVVNAAWPLVAHGQQRAVPVIGFMSSRSFDESSSLISAFKQGLNEAGLNIGQNVAIEYRWADGDYARLPQLAAELVNRQVDVLLGGRWASFGTGSQGLDFDHPDHFPGGRRPGSPRSCRQPE